jgi:hypothetical protein
MTIDMRGGFLKGFDSPRLHQKLSIGEVMRDSGIRTGGLMRCCIASIWDDTRTDQEGMPGKCKYCEAPLLYKDGAWEWAPEPERVGKE